MNVTSFVGKLRSCLPVIVIFACAAVAVRASADDSLKRESSWQVHDADKVSQFLREGLDKIGTKPGDIDSASDEFLAAVRENDTDPLEAYIDQVIELIPAIEKISTEAEADLILASKRLDPSAEGYADIEGLPATMRNSVRTWLGRRLVRQRLYDEALPVIAEVDPSESADPASALFYRGACYHALLMKPEALADLRKLLENEDDVPVRYSRTAKLMVADIKPLKTDSLDEISRLMNDVTRRLDLGRSNEEVEDREQKIIDKLTKLIEKLQEQQQQQQQSGGGQAENGGNPQGQSSPMDDSRIAGASGDGNVDKKKFDDDIWGNVPPAERKQALQQISRDLPTHYRDAIEAYFRKIATDN